MASPKPFRLIGNATMFPGSSRRLSRSSQLSILLLTVASLACSGFGLDPSLGWQAADAPDTSSEATVDAEAEAAETEYVLGTLQRMSEFLATQPSLRFEAETQYDTVQDSGAKIEFGTHRRYAFAFPNRARIEVEHRDGATELMTFDGERFSAAIPDQQVYASIEYEGTIGEAFDHLNREYDVVSPLLDLLRRDLTKDLAAHVLSARDLGRVTIEGTSCDQFLLRSKNFDFQVYVRAGDAPVPMRLVVDYLAEPGRPGFRAQVSKWVLGEDVADADFRFIPPAGAQRVPVPELLEILLGPAEDTR